MIRICLLALCVSRAFCACLSINSERISAGDLARADAAFLALDPLTDLGFAPAPGTRRIFTRAESMRLGRRSGVELAPLLDGLCVERAMQTLSPERVRSAMAQQLGIAESAVEIVALVSCQVPAGEVHFPRSGLGMNPVSPRAPLYWRGFVTYAERKRFPIWARIRITGSYSRVVASEDLRPGQLISPAQLRVEPYEGMPDVGGPTVEDIAGHVPVRTIRAGTPVLVSALSPKAEIERDSLVQMEALIGTARVITAGRAEASGIRGQIIPVRNLETKKVVKANVEAPGRVRVCAGGVGHK
jgi:flagella basal body P-ring formation protein FlgA